MDPVRIAVRIVFTYILLRIFVRLAGKRSVKHASPFDFTVSLIIGDMMDDAIWAEVDAGTFVVATAALMIAHLTFEYFHFKAETPQ